MNTTVLYVLADSIRANYKRTQFGRREWIEGSLDLARNFWKARQEFDDNQEFSVWLVKNDLDYFNKDDRAALINMGEDIELTKRVLEETRLFSYQLIWRDDIKPRLLIDKNTASIPVQVSNQQKPAEIPANSSNGAEKNLPIIVHLPAGRQRGMSERNPLAEKPRAEEVWNRYHGRKTRAALVKAVKHPGGNELWSLILTAIDQGFLKETNSETNTFSARMLFTEAPPNRGFLTNLDLATSKGRTFVKDVLMPAAIINREAILAEPDRIEQIIDEYRQAQRVEAHKQAQEREVQKAVSRLPAGQQQVVVYGETFWPPTDSMYDYDQLRAAVWYFRNVSGLLSDGRDNSVGSVAIGIRQSIKFLSEYATFRSDQKKMQTIFSLVRNITLVWEQNPNAECKWPMYPIGGEEGKW
jgi:hypothetical protein